MARVTVEFDTDKCSDGKVFIDGEQVKGIRYFHITSGYDRLTSFLINRLVLEDGKMVKVTDESGEYYALEDTFDVFNYLKLKDNQL